MASSKIKGITIELSADTTKLQNALKQTNNIIKGSQSELKNLNSLLKFDPGNTTLLQQKQILLADAIKGTTEKLKTLIEYKRLADQDDNVNKNTKEYRELEREIAATEQQLQKFVKQEDENNKALKGNTKNVNDFGNELDDAGKKTLKLGDLIKANLISEAIKKGFKELANAAKQVASGIVDIGKTAVSSYADYEQLIGGVETLFKDSAGIVEEYANNAYKTAGISANEYMEQATSFSASLLQSLGGDTKKAADVTDMAIKDMADNANKMGTSMESIQNAYQGFAKQNYTMLDNLKLGYGGTKNEMKRLLEDAEKFSGIKYDINSLNDVYQAIHVIQGELGITGTTALEAEKTISGSANAMKSSWKNFMTGLASGNKNLTSLLDNVIDSAMTLADNILPVVEQVASSIVKILPKVLEQILANLPKFLEAGVSILNTLIEGLSSNMELIIQAIMKIIGTIGNVILTNLPTILKMGIQLLIELAKGIATALPQLIPQIVECLLTMVNTLLDNIDMIIDTGIQLMMGLIDGLINAIPILIDKAPEIIDKLIMAIANNLPKIVVAGAELSFQLAIGIAKAIPKILSKIPEIIWSLIKGFGKYMVNIWDIGKNIISGIIKGFTDFDIGKAIKETCKKMLNGIKSFFGIRSPSKLMQKEVGRFLPMGISKGFEKEIPNTIKEVDKALGELNTGIQTNINPTINPQANTNPLILQIENFNNQRNTDVQALAEELEFYRKNSSLAVGGR